MAIKRRRRIEITIEREQVAISGRSEDPVTGWCSQCSADVDMTSPEAAAEIFDVAPRAIYRWIESGQVHFFETPDGKVQVCIRSLRAACEAEGER